MTCSFRFYTILAFLKNGILQIARRALVCKSGEFGFGYLLNTDNSKPCIISKHHGSNISHLKYVTVAKHWCFFMQEYKHRDSTDD